MKRTTSREVKTAIREYLLDCMDFSGYDLDESKMSIAEKVTTCYRIFKEEKSYEIKRIGERAAFTDWLRGLASALSVDFYYFDERALIESWLDQQDSEKYPDEKVDALYWHLLTREFFAMLATVKERV